ncbi:histidine phosphatase family protein [Dictyobacter arantiisoli]|uniref:Phosphatase n=1 Tax=Dictyobacter arantiisoli TaxID=2014874 RepID=A0A5A5T7D9_9CHLR|nr:histidine phosphatase family protein [Dictyobacter arantiisoli]GCF06913.1 phosphatase [Dictyobacter arantiisoli]
MTKKTTLYITRHGQTEWNVERRIQGYTDSPLTATGKLQASWLGAALEDTEFTTIYASSSGRTQQTAEIIRGTRQLPIIASDDLREIGLGSWEGRLTEEIQLEDPEEYQAYRDTPHLYQARHGGETFDQIRQRVVTKIHEIVTHHEGQNILVVTHAVAIKALMNDLEERPLARFWEPPFIHPTSLSKIIYRDRIPTIELYGDISHYQIPIETPERKR